MPLRATLPAQSRHTAFRVWLAAIGVAVCPAVLAQAAPAVNEPRPAAPAASTRAPARSPATSPPGAAAATPAPVTPRTRIELPPAERQALSEGSTPVPSQGGASVNELLPQADDANRPNLDRPVTEIEQIRTGNRVTEIRVTPALTGRTYVIENREQRQPITATGSTSGLTLPRLFTFEFGRGDERTAPSSGSAPPPPSSQSR